MGARKTVCSMISCFEMVVMGSTEEAGAEDDDGTREGSAFSFGPGVRDEDARLLHQGLEHRAAPGGVRIRCDYSLRCNQSSSDCPCSLLWFPVCADAASWRGCWTLL